ncbi:MAG: hypothetical protein K2X87_13245, partial [Gemmataceae bacterium]|nr:hypothetical protein [Gemmataceae bacterium]
VLMPPGYNTETPGARCLQHGKPLTKPWFTPVFKAISGVMAELLMDPTNLYSVLEEKRRRDILADEELLRNANRPGGASSTAWYLVVIGLAALPSLFIGSCGAIGWLNESSYEWQVKYLIVNMIYAGLAWVVCACFTKANTSLFSIVGITQVIMLVVVPLPVARWLFLSYPQASGS